MFKDKKVIVVGMARSGISAAKALIKAGAIVTVNDSKTDIELDFQVEKDFGGPPSHLDYDFMVLSPGVPTDLPFVLEAKSKLKVIGALEVGYLLSKGQFYGITGTNGKTTTTTLTYEIFKAAECDAYAVGNIGNSVASVAYDTTEKSHLITEVSSFQLESVDQFKVHIAAILNFAPDHLNRHKTMENYIESKCRIAENQTSEDYLLLNFDNEGTRTLDTKQFKSKIIYFSKTPIDQGFFIDGDVIVAKFSEKVELLPLSLIHVPGDHNLENILAAVGVAYLAGVPIEAIHKAISEFRGVAHRIEYVGTHRGIKCYNDSKGTNPDSSIVAVKAMTAPTLLIAGGMDKGSEFDEFVSYFKNVKSLILLGETKETIAEAAKKSGFDKIVYVDNMEEAVEKAFEIGEAGDLLLLSPACASWDMYPSFEVRGEHFKSCLEKY